MATNYSDYFKDFKFSNIIAIISFALFVIFYITLKSLNSNNTSGILALQVLSLFSIITFIITIVKTFIPSSPNNINTNFASTILLFLTSFWNSIKTFVYNIFDFLKIFFVDFVYSLKELMETIIFPDVRIIFYGIVGLILLIILGIVLYYLGININFEKIKQYTKAKQTIYSIFVFIAVALVLSGIIPQLYSLDKSFGSRIALFVAMILLISVLLSGFFVNEIYAGNYRNYGTLLFNILIFVVFIYLIYGLQKFLFEQSSPTLENYSIFEYFLYYYLFPIIFFVGYILYYIFVYRNEKLSFTDFSDYRVIIFNIMSFVIGIYLIYQFYQLFLKKRFSVDNSIFQFIASIFKFIPCIFSILKNYFEKNVFIGIASIAVSFIFILLMLFLSGVISHYESWYMILLYIIGGIALISGIIKGLLATTKMGDTKVFQLLQKTILTLPCLFLLGANKAFGEGKFGTISELLFIVMITFFVFFYNVITTTIIPDIYEKHTLNGGKQVLNKPITLTKHTFISSYSDLFAFNDSQMDETNPNKFDYKYGLSFWLYLDSFAPLNSQLYDICSLGDGLMVKYNSMENVLYFMYAKKEEKDKKYENTKQAKKNDAFGGIEPTTDKINEDDPNDKTLTMEEMQKWKTISKRKKLFEKFLQKNVNFNNEIGTKGNVDSNLIVIHKEKDVLLQKWNSIIVNYYGGTIDIFINGKIVGSKINVVPYIVNTALTVGMDNGTNGKICNLIYYKSPMSKTSIYRMYNIFKNKNPPTIDKSETSAMDVSKSLEVYFAEFIEKMK